MENYKDETHFFDTASSDFYPKKNEDTLKPATTPLNAYGNRLLVEGLESQSSKIKEILCANQIRIEGLQSREGLKMYAKETNQQIQIIHSKVQAEISMAKDAFVKNMSSLDRQLSSLKREWKNYKEKQQNILNEAMEELRVSKKQNQNVLTSLLKDTGIELKGAFTTLGKQLKQLNKDRMQKKSGFMLELDILQNTLNSRVQAERKKRAEYEQIVLVLLDKTCDAGERILRRIC